MDASDDADDFVEAVGAVADVDPATDRILVRESAAWRTPRRSPRPSVTFGVPVVNRRPRQQRDRERLRNNRGWTTR